MGSFKKYVEEMDMLQGMSSPEAAQALVWIKSRYHGANADELAELKSPNFPYILMRKFGLSPHEVQEPIQAALEEFGLA